MADFFGPEQIALATATSVGSFFFNRPVVFNKGNQRFALVLDTQHNPWRLRAYLRNNSNGTWAEQDAGNGPTVNRGVFPIGGHTTVLGGYVAGSLVLDVVSTAGDPAIPFVGVPPFNVVVGNPVGTILAQLTVSAVNTPTQFAVAAFGVDNNAPGGTGVFQIGQSDPKNAPFCCPTYIRDPLNPDSIVAAYNDAQLSQLSFVAFNLASKTWGAPTGGGPQVYGVDLVFNGSVSNDDTGAKCCIGYRSSDNKFVFNFQGPPEALAHNCLRPYYVTYDRTAFAWGTAVPLAGAGEDNPYEAHGIVVDPVTNEVHATVIKPTDGVGVLLGTTYEIWHVAVDPNDTINPKDLATDTVLRFREPEVGYPVLRPVGLTFELLVPFTQNSAAAATRRAAVVRALVGIAPAWSTEIINADTEKGPINQDFSAPSIALGVGGLPYAFWPGAPTSGLEVDLWSSKGGNAGSGWGAEAKLFSVDPNAGGFMDRIAVSPLPGLDSIGIVSFDLGNPDPEIVAYFELRACQVGIMKGVGILIKDWQGKAYMNDFVPAELIFGFDNSQTPGLVYPEIYIPKNQALYLDVAPFGPLNGLLTLTFKGKKVYE